MSLHTFDELAAREIFLNPGQLGCGGQDEVFGTLLGSCVSITLWHAPSHVGSICHFILPNAPTLIDVAGKYGDSAFANQVRDLLQYGISLEQCSAKIFGGGQMFSHSGTQDIGLKNILAARTLLSTAGVPIVAENVGGEGYRRLYFDLASGAVWIKFDWLDGNLEDRIL